MFNTTLLKPINVLIIGVIAFIWVMTLGKFFTSHIQKDSSK